MNYQIELERILSKQKKKETLLLHSCCAPCSSYVLEFLRPFFEITVYYYNPNITDWVEYEKRAEEQRRFIDAINDESPQAGMVKFVKESHQPEVFWDMSQGLEQEAEGGKRCVKCYQQRLLETAKKAKREEYSYFATTLTISPMKNAAVLNEVGQAIAEEIGIAFLPSDFKKKNGYKRSVELSEEYELYRQDYCGCIYSKTERDRLNKG